MFAVLLELVMWIMLKRVDKLESQLYIFYLRAFTNMLASYFCSKMLSIDIMGIAPTQRLNIRVLIFVSFFASGLSFLSYMINPLTIATILIYTSILFTSIFAFFKFSEKVDRYDAVNVLVSIASVILIMNFFDEKETRVYEVIIGVIGALFLGL